MFSYVRSFVDAKAFKINLRRKWETNKNTAKVIQNLQPLKDEA